MRGWGTGNGRDVARGLLGDSGSIPNPGLRASVVYWLCCKLLDHMARLVTCYCFLVG